MNLFNLDLSSLVLFFGGLVRISAALVAAPIFSHPAIPHLVKILVAFSLTLAIFPTAHLNAGAAIDPNSLSDVIILTLKESLVGFTLGFTARIIFDSLTFAFVFVGMQMGFAFSVYYDPSSDSNTPTVSQFMMILMTLVFFAFDGHHLIIRALADSFSAVPLGNGVINNLAATYILETGSQIFLIGLRLAAPVAVVIFVVNLAFGVVARSVPQINVIIVSFTVNILVGLVVLSIMLPMLGMSMSTVAGEMFTRLQGVMRVLNG